MPESRTPPPKEKVLYWTILGRPRGTSTWMQVPYIPQKNRCSNHFATQTRAEKCAAHIAERSNPVWLPKEKAWTPYEYVVAKVVLPEHFTLHKGKS